MNITLTEAIDLINPDNPGVMRDLEQKCETHEEVCQTIESACRLLCETARLRTGNWIRQDNGRWKCERCGTTCLSSKPTDYCHKCGVLMVGRKWN